MGKPEDKELYERTEKLEKAVNDLEETIKEIRLQMKKLDLLKPMLESLDRIEGKMDKFILVFGMSAKRQGDEQALVDVQDEFGIDVEKHMAGKG